MPTVASAWAGPWKRSLERTRGAVAVALSAGGIVAILMLGRLDTTTGRLIPIPFAAVPASAAWTHRGARTGFEVVYLDDRDGGARVHGCTTAVEDGHPWIVDYTILLDVSWRTLQADPTCRSAVGSRSTILMADGEGSWRVDGTSGPLLDGCLDVDLGSSTLTNTFPVHRMALLVGEAAKAPAAYVRTDAWVERLEQAFQRVAGHDTGQRFAYVAPAAAFTCSLARV
jgi:uncharacterized protein